MNIIIRHRRTTGFSDPLRVRLVNLGFWTHREVRDAHANRPRYEGVEMTTDNSVLRRPARRAPSGQLPASSFGMDSHQATLEEDVTLLNGQTSSSRTGQTSGLPW